MIRKGEMLSLRAGKGRGLIEVTVRDARRVGSCTATSVVAAAFISAIAFVTAALVTGAALVCVFKNASYGAVDRVSPAPSRT